MIFATISFLLIASAAAIPTHDHEHTHVLHKRLPDTWHQPPDHPVHALFRRAPGTDGVVYPSVGTPSKCQLFLSDRAAFDY